MKYGYCFGLFTVFLHLNSLYLFNINNFMNICGFKDTFEPPTPTLNLNTYQPYKAQHNTQKTVQSQVFIA